MKNLKFYLRSAPFTTSFKNPTIISVGDSFQTVVRKYKDYDTQLFIGNTYAFYKVAEVTQKSQYSFETTCYTSRQLVFDSRGIIMIEGMSTQIITLDTSYNINELHVIKNELYTITGTNDFDGIRGSYNPKSISPHFYEATIDYTIINDTNNVTINDGNNLYYILLLIIIILVAIYMIYKLNKVV
jgi:hypothetical protein